jgi:hypothetical protein
MKVGLCDHHAACVSMHHPYQIWMPEPIFMKLGMYVIAPNTISMACFINPFHQSVSVCVSLLGKGSPKKLLRQRIYTQNKRTVRLVFYSAQVISKEKETINYSRNFFFPLIDVLQDVSILIQRDERSVWQHGPGNVGLRSCPSVYLLSARRHVLIAGINCETPGTIVTQVIKFRINLMWTWIPLRPAHTISCRLLVAVSDRCAWNLLSVVNKVWFAVCCEAICTQTKNS